MSWMLRAMKKCFGMTSRGAQHVSFSASTVNLQRERTMRNIASPIPFQNFLNDLRLTALDDYGKDRMSMRESSMMRKSGVRLWSLLTDEQKNKYRQLAVNALETRLPLHLLSGKKSTPFLGTETDPQLAPSEPFVDWRRPTRALSDGQVDRRTPKRRSKLVKGTKNSMKVKKLKSTLRKTYNKHLPRSKSVSLPSPTEIQFPIELNTPPQTSRQPSRKRKLAITGSVNDSDCESTETLQTLPELNNSPPAAKPEAADGADMASPLHREIKRRRMTKPTTD